MVVKCGRRDSRGNSEGIQEGIQDVFKSGFRREYPASGGTAKEVNAAAITGTAGGRCAQA
jgi:hypothetical protein